MTIEEAEALVPFERPKPPRKDFPERLGLEIHKFVIPRNYTVLIPAQNTISYNDRSRCRTPMANKVVAELLQDAISSSSRANISC